MVRAAVTPNDIDRLFGRVPRLPALGTDTMKPTWETNDGAIRLYCADCLDVLPTLEAGSVDAVVTDPPYGIGWKAGTWDDDPAKYPALMAFLVSEANRLVENGWCFVFQAMLNVGRFHEWFPPDFRLFASAKLRANSP